MARRSRRCWSPLLALTCIMGATSYWPVSTARAESTLKVVIHAELRNLDPIWTTSLIAFNYGNMVLDTLFSLDTNLNAHPQMIETHTVSQDQLTWTFTLRPGLKFSDGKVVTSADVVASLKRWGQRAPDGRVLMERMASLETKDDKTFAMTLKKAYPLMLQSLAGIATTPFIFREEEAKTDAFAEIKESIGSGPFIFIREEWVPGAKVVYRKNPGYVPRSDPPNGYAGGKAAKVDRVEWYNIPEVATQASALIRGEMDMIEAPAHDLIPQLRKSSDIVVRVINPLGRQAVLRPNHLVPPFNNVKARQALMLVGSQQEYLTAMVGSDPEMQKVCHAPFVCGTENESLVGAEPYLKPDPEKAKQLMKEAGYDGRPIAIMTPTDLPVLHNMTVYTADLLRQIGLNADLQATDWATLVQRRTVKDDPQTNKGGWHIFQTTWPSSLQSHPFLNISAATPCDGKNWFGWACDESMEKMRIDFLDAATPQQRKTALEAFQRKFFEVLPYRVLGQMLNPIAYRKNVEGVLDAPELVYWNIVRN
ncbi:MAG: ABC transporter substrate-binding protein [Proteobacteria bacterium]|nr:ABC transporter substrate-binding protein [Pseudomonadota bacterium]MBI3496990.1 ABC transporter substrate-binding protein [Pseudomonadota bacterium]